MPIFWLSLAHHHFPDPAHASDEGIVAIGGDLSPDRLLVAYQQGIFPWNDPDEPLLWWSPDPRMVLFPAELRVSKSMRKVLKSGQFRVTFDTAFERVMENCRTRGGRSDGTETWISDTLIDSFTQLHRAGFAHSVEVWQGEALVGGLYGLALGRIFFGESMFAAVSNASKVGFITLVERLSVLGFELIDCQQDTPHLASLGASPIARTTFLEHLRNNEFLPDVLRGTWKALGQ